MTDITAFAYVNHGRWVADCPFCGGAEQAWPEGIRTDDTGKIPYPFGLSAGKLHCGYTGATCAVIYPESRRAIARVLARRPVEQTRNWHLHETLDHLRRENAERGVA